jgi:hypothetical protein
MKKLTANPQRRRQDEWAGYVLEVTDSPLSSDMSERNPVTNEGLISVVDTVDWNYFSNLKNDLHIFFFIEY